VAPKGKPLRRFAALARGEKPPGCYLVTFSAPPSEATWLENACLVAFSEPPSEATWLENAYLVAFSEPPSEATWLENA
jgi:hypothetical protein